MSINVTNLVGFGAGGAGRAVTLINRGSISTSTSGGTTHTFSSYGIGTASSTRRVIAYVVGDSSDLSSGTVSSATIGGVSATIDCQVTGGTYTNVSAIISATVPTGTTATIAVTFSQGIARAAVVAVAVDNLGSATPIDTLTDTARILTGTVDWQVDGFVFGGSSNQNGSDSCSWSGLSKREETAFSGLDVTFADLFPTSSSSGATVSATWGLTDAQTMAVASYR
jgi:hypothetical protein